MACCLERTKIKAAIFSRPHLSTILRGGINEATSSVILYETNEKGNEPPKFSQSTTPANNPYTLSTLATAIDKAMGRGFTKLLEATGMFKLIESSQIGKFLGEGARLSRSSVRPWPSSFPKLFAHTTVSKVKEHPNFAAAKRGDVDAAQRLVASLAKTDRLQLLAKEYPDAIVVGVMEIEPQGNNQIPNALAAEISRHGLKVDQDIVSVSKVSHKDKDAVERLLARKEFEGAVIKGAQYIIADDVVTQGGTIHELRHYIENNGGHVVSVTSLAFSAGSNIIAIKQETISSIQHKFNREQLERILRDENIAGTIEALTESEGRTILKFGTLDAFRNRIVEARKSEGFASNDAGTGTLNRLEPPSGNPDIRYSKDGRILAFVISGQTFLVADNISSTDDNVKGLLTHEISSHALELGLSTPEYLKIVHRFKAMARMGNKKAQDGMKRVPADTPAHLVDQEGMSYFLEANPDLPFAKQFVAWFRAQLRKIGKALPSLQRMQWFNAMTKISDNDIIYMATQALKNAPTTLQNARSRGVFKAEDAKVTNEGMTLFSKASQPESASAQPKSRVIGDSGRAYTPEQRAANERTGSVVTQKSIKETIAKYWQDAGKNLAQGLVDQFRPIRDLDDHAYTLMRLSKGATGAFEAFMHHGKLSIKDGAFDADTTGGVLEKVFFPLGKESTDFLRWIAGNRAERLSGEGKENLFTPEDIAAFKSLSDGEIDFYYTMPDGTVTRDRPTMMDNNRKTIMVDGVERPAQNSEGRPIHWSEEGTRNFWRWFDEIQRRGLEKSSSPGKELRGVNSLSVGAAGSSTTDALGRPRVYYHGTSANIAAMIHATVKEEKKILYVNEDKRQQFESETRLYLPLSASDHAGVKCNIFSHDDLVKFEQPTRFSVV